MATKRAFHALRSQVKVSLEQMIELPLKSKVLMKSFHSFQLLWQQYVVN